MKFNDQFHFKNYVRKIAESTGYDKSEFDKTKIPAILLDIYRFQLENEMEMFAIGAPNIIDHFMTELKQINYREESQRINIFLEKFIELNEIYEQAIIVCENLKKEKLKAGFNLFNYFDKDFLYPHHRLKRLVKENSKFNYLNEEELIPSSEFKNLIETHVGKFGLYFLYNKDKALMYIGKSTNLGNRILSSISERKITGFIKIALTERIADMHVYEAYYILKENPFLNVEFKSDDDLDMELQPLEKSKLIKILSRN